MFKKRLYLIIFILFTLTLLGAGCLGTDEATNTNGAVKGAVAEQEKAEVNVTLIINTGEKKDSYNLTVLPNAKVLDVLKSASAQYNIPLEIKDSAYGPLVQGLAGKSGGEGGKFWLYYVNGQMAPVGVAEQSIKEGDNIEFRFE